MAYQIADVVQAAREEGGIILKELRADGGAAGDAYLMQFQSDILNLPLSVSGREELSATGAVWMAGMALGLYDSSVHHTMKRRRYVPAMEAVERERRLVGWREAVAKIVTG
ncbi:MAG: glycerol kinase, partial [Spirochaetaceae bacterium]|jgi:glycerol kinase|nr:glycerol kinase [Spirochaetaceae bacterium]